MRLRFRCRHSGLLQAFTNASIAGAAVGIAAFCASPSSLSCLMLSSVVLTMSANSVLVDCNSLAARCAFFEMCRYASMRFCSVVSRPRASCCSVSIR